MRVLLVEDEPDAATQLARGLRERSYAVDVAGDGDAAVEKACVNSYDLILLDLMLPGKDGLTVCREIRAMGSAAPILMLTARGDTADRIQGLDSGADDYLAKPFDLNELLARMRALLRRAPVLRETVLRVADLEINTHSHTVTRDGTAIALTGKEYSLLEYLALRQGAVVGREEISEHVWDEAYDPFSNLIEVYIQRLRRKVDLPGLPRLLHTRRGEGYRLAAAGEADA
ncbi:MAG TPA: response regulator transcription factor [Bryobacteraceae bacterium]|nr:response regulator transcription factor [Bryobacteraceae bacterium]